MPIIRVGPYALWTVPEDRVTGPPAHPEYSEPLFADALDCIDTLPPVDRGGRPHRRICYLPSYPIRPGGPRGAVGGVVPPVQPQVIDLRAVDPAAEVAAFAAAYATELAGLASAFGGPPELGWGWAEWDPGW
jgi:hypothetical protein